MSKSIYDWITTTQTKTCEDREISSEELLKELHKTMEGMRSWTTSPTGRIIEKNQRFFDLYGGGNYRRYQEYHTDPPSTFKGLEARWEGSDKQLEIIYIPRIETRSRRARRRAALLGGKS